MMSQEMMRRVAPRAEEALERHKDDAPWMGPLVYTVGVSAPALILIYDEVEALESARKAIMASRVHTTALLRDMRGWAGLVQRYIPTFRRGEFGDNPGVADDVISDVQKLIATVDKHEQQTGEIMPFSDKLRTTLTAGLEAAKQEWGTASALDSNYARKRAELREACERFNKDLVGLRVALETLLGSSHPDYRRLRISSARSVGEEGDEDADEDGEGDEVTEIGSGTIEAGGDAKLA